MKKITVVLADDHVLVRNGIKSMLENEPSIEVIGEANNGREALDKVSELCPDVVILDIRMPEMTGLEATQVLTNSSSTTKALILSMHDSDDYVLQALDAGAFGYLLKDIDRTEFIKAIHQVHSGTKYFAGAVSNVLAQQILRGGASSPKAKIDQDPQTDKYQLTKREHQILKLIIEGKHNKEVADLLGKSVRTVETHRFNIMKKLNVNNAIDLVNKAMKEHLV